MLRARDNGSGNVLAAGLGAVTPFCSCSTVPVLAGLLGAGAPTGMAFSFLLASPIVNWIGALIHGAVPAELLQRIAGPGNPLATPMAALAGAPISIPNLILLNKLFERRLLAIYATTVVTIGITRIIRTNPTDDNAFESQRPRPIERDEDRVRARRGAIHPPLPLFSARDEAGVGEL